MAPLTPGHSWPHDEELASQTPSTTSTGANLQPHIFERQSTTTETVCSGTYLSDGALAGIVIGTIAGTLLVLWIFWSCFNQRTPVVPDREPAYRDAKPRHRHHSSHSGHRRRSSDVSGQPPIVLRESSRHRHQQPAQVYVSGKRGRAYV